MEHIVKSLLLWFENHQRQLPWRQTKDPYRIWVSEIMLQQTRVAAVIDYYNRFLTALPTVQALAAVSEEELMRLWAGLGYYSRGRNLQKAASIIIENGGFFPSTYVELLDLPGIGPYTAGAVASIAFGEPVACVDGNVLRVLSRLRLDKRDIMLPTVKAEVKETLEQVLRKLTPEHISAFNQALMELGAVVCVPNAPPLCTQCPLAQFCKAYQAGVAETLPVKSPKKKRRREDKTVLLLLRDGQTALEKRSDKGLLAGLWQFPNAQGHLSPEEVIAFTRSLGLEPLRVLPAGTKKHIFTHVEWDLVFYKVTVSQIGGANLVWTDMKRLRDAYAVPTAFLPPKERR